MTDAEELEIYKKYKESVPRQKQIMQEIIDEVTANKPEQEKMLQHCEEFISLYEEKQQQESDQSFKN